jgi:hypothetical protein
LDIDYHISLYLGKGIKRLEKIGLINFFRYLVSEYFFIHGTGHSYVSLVQTSYEQIGLVATYPFFKKRFFFSFFKKFKIKLFSNIFKLLNFSCDFYLSLIDFYLSFFFNRILNFLKLYFFFNFVCFFVFILDFFFYLNFFINFFFFLDFFFLIFYFFFFIFFLLIF